MKVPFGRGNNIINHFMFRGMLIMLFMTGTIVAGGQTKHEKAVANAAEMLRLAMVSGNKDTLEQIVMPQLSYGHSGGHVDDKTEFVDKLTSGKSDFVSINITDQAVTVVKDVAILRHKLHAETADKGVPGTVDLLVMMVWHKTNQGWKLLARQAVKAK